MRHINRVLALYNNTPALNLTPAGQVLVQNGIFTPAQMGNGNSLCYNNPKSQPSFAVRGRASSAACTGKPSQPFLAARSLIPGLHGPTGSEKDSKYSRVLVLTTFLTSSILTCLAAR